MAPYLRCSRHKFVLGMRSQTLILILIRMFFCFHRRSALSDEIQARFKELVLESEEKYGFIVRALETMADHVHLLMSIPPTESVGIIVGKIKSMTAKVLREEFPHLKSRLPNLWTRSYFVASTGGVALEVLKQYVASQKGV